LTRGHGEGLATPSHGGGLNRNNLFYLRRWLEPEDLRNFIPVFISGLGGRGWSCTWLKTPLPVEAVHRQTFFLAGVCVLHSSPRGEERSPGPDTEDRDIKDGTGNGRSFAVEAEGHRVRAWAWSMRYSPRGTKRRRSKKNRLTRNKLVNKKSLKTGPSGKKNVGGIRLAGKIAVVEGFGVL